MTVFYLDAKLSSFQYISVKGQLCYLYINTYYLIILVKFSS